MVMVAMLVLVWLAVRSIICVNLPLILNPVEKVWLSQVWWVKCILRYITPSEGVERTTKTQRTQRSIDPM